MNQFPMLGSSVSTSSTSPKLCTMGNGRRLSKQWHIWQQSVDGKANSGMELNVREAEQVSRRHLMLQLVHRSFAY
jgi:hypothetical protein